MGGGRRSEGSLGHGEHQMNFDPDFNGPVKKRRCTDVLCCGIFIVVLLGYVALGAVAWVYGDPRRMIYPTDSHGQFCGLQGTPNANKSTLFYFNILHCATPAMLAHHLQCPTTQLCVSECPDRFLTFVEMQKKYKHNSTYWHYYRQFCRPGFDNPEKSLSQILIDEDCPSMLIPSRPFLQRCFPDFTTRNKTLMVANRSDYTDAQGHKRGVAHLRDATNGIANLLSARQMGTKISEDLARSWYWILMSLVVTMVISWFFILLLKLMAGVLVWVTIIGIISAGAYGLVHCFGEYTRLGGDNHGDITLTDLGFQMDLSVYLQLRPTWIIFMIVLAVMELCIIVMLIFLRRRLHLSIALLQEGSRAIGFVKSTLLYPIIPFILLTLCTGYWVTIAICLASPGEPVFNIISTEPSCKQDNLTCDPQMFRDSPLCPGSQCVFVGYGSETGLRGYAGVLQLCNTLVFLWLVNFVQALNECTLAGTFASYYWTLNKPYGIPACPLAAAFGRALRYHSGSLAFGALILSIVQLFRILLEYVDRKLKGSHNALVRFLLCCLRCCLWCLERFIRFMNRNIYIMIAINGTNFCTSARDVVSLLMRNMLKLAILDKVTDFLLFLGKLLILGTAGALAFSIFTGQIPLIQEKVPALNYLSVPLLVVIMVSYMVAHVFFNVFSMCLDTLLFSYLMDLELNDGSAARPYYMSSTLRSVLHKKNQEGTEKKRRRCCI